MAHVAKVLVIKPRELSVIPATHMVKERLDSYKLSSDLHGCTTAQFHPHTYTSMQNK